MVRFAQKEKLFIFADEVEVCLNNPKVFYNFFYRCTSTMSMLKAANSTASKRYSAKNMADGGQYNIFCRRLH